MNKKAVQDEFGDTPWWSSFITLRERLKAVIHAENPEMSMAEVSHGAWYSAYSHVKAAIERGDDPPSNAKTFAALTSLEEVPQVEVPVYRQTPPKAGNSKPAKSSSKPSSKSENGSGSGQDGQGEEDPEDKEAKEEADAFRYLRKNAPRTDGQGDQWTEVRWVAEHIDDDPSELKSIPKIEIPSKIAVSRLKAARRDPKGFWERDWQKLMPSKSQLDKQGEASNVDGALEKAYEEIKESGVANNTAWDVEPEPEHVGGS